MSQLSTEPYHAGKKTIPEELERQREKERIRKRVSRANAKLKLEEDCLKEKHAGEIVTNYIAKKEMLKSE